MATHYFTALKPPKRCICGELAVTGYRQVTDGISTGTTYLCATHAIETEKAIPPKKKGRPKGIKPFHNEFGRSNSDVQSPVSQSIRNWGTKIKARTA